MPSGGVIMKLDFPSVQYKDSFLEALREFHAEGSSFDLLANLNAASLMSDFEDYVRQLIDQSKGKSLPQGWISHTTYWIIDNDEFMGVIDLRHGLTPALEKYGGHVGYAIRPSKRRKSYATEAVKMLIPLAFRIGIKRVLITCDTNNTASIKVIESNGGILQDEIQNEGRKVLTRRYWIEIPAVERIY
jgi:predicted acetyltransferase